MQPDDPDRSGIVEDAPRYDEPDDQVVEGDRPRRRDDDHRVGEDREHRDQREEVEVHLDLHRPLTEVREETPHQHRRDAVDERDGARSFEPLERDKRANARGDSQSEGEQRPRVVEPCNGREDGDVQGEEREADPVHTGEVARLELRHFARQDEKLQDVRHVGQLTGGARG